MELETEIMEAYTVVFDHLHHLGPGDSATTRHLVERLGSDLPRGSRVADFGCGVGVSALVLVSNLQHGSIQCIHLLATTAETGWLAGFQ